MSVYTRPHSRELIRGILRELIACNVHNIPEIFQLVRALYQTEIIKRQGLQAMNLLPHSKAIL